MIKRKKALCENIINNDMKLFANEHSDMITDDGSGIIIYNGCLKIHVIEDSLEIIDMRGAAYGWYFEVIIDELFTGDLFEYHQKFYSVSDLRKTTILDWENEISKVIEKNNRSIDIINKFNHNKKDYMYYAEHECIKCKDFNEIIKVVLEREPIQL